MKIFHYVSSVLKKTPLFNCAYDEEFTEGAIFNDFDADPSDLLFAEDESCPASTSFTNTSNLLPVSSLSFDDIVPESAIDYALITADDRDGVFADQLSFDHPLYDIVNEIDSKEYLSNVYSIVSGAWKDICPLITDDVEDIYNRRLRLKWTGKDSFYDMWLLATNNIRSCFPVRKMTQMYPDWQGFLVESSDSSTDSDSENDTGSDVDSESESEEIEKANNDTVSEKNVTVVKKETPFVPVTHDSNIISISSDDEECIGNVCTVKKEVMFRANNHFSNVILLSSDDEANIESLNGVKREALFVPSTHCVDAILISSEDED